MVGRWGAVWEVACRTGWRRTALFSLAVLAVLAARILHANGGVFTYTLDDPYIHLALSERLAQGFYGLNAGEPASPSSSILFPFLIAAGAGTALHVYLPFILNVAATVALLGMLLRLLGRAGILEGRFGRAYGEILVLVFVVSLNIYGLVFTGMEHSIQVLAALATAAGLVESLESGRTPWWLALAIVLNPLIRFEGMGVSVAALVCLWMDRRRWTAALLGMALAAALAAYGIFMHRLGLPFFPSSVLTKSRIAQAGEGGSLWSLATLLAGNAMAAVRHQPSAQLLAAAAGLAALQPLAGLILSRLGWKAAPTRGDTLAALFVVLVAAAHLAGGHYGWFGRYEVYALAAALAPLAWLWRREAAGLIRIAAGGRLPARLAAGAVLAALLPVLPLTSRHLGAVTWTTPAAAHNVYQQHYQMHRFLTEFYPAPSAVCDLGYAAFGNPNYVLDLRGLGSEPARRAQLAGQRPKDWIRALSEPHGVDVALLYDVAFPRLPEGWRRLAYLRLEGPRVTAADSIVTVYATRPESAPRILEQLRRFQAVLPPDATLEMAEDGAYRPGEVVDFGEAGKSYRYKLDGWWVAEGLITWTWAREANLLIPLREGFAGDAELVADLTPFLAPGKPAQEVEVLADGRPVARWSVTGAGEQRALVPAELVKGDRPLRLGFRIAHPVAPVEVGLSTDDRPLGIAMRTLRLVPVPAAGPTAG